MQGTQGLDRRFVEVTVEPQDRQALDRGGRQRVAEPTFEEPHLAVEKPVSAEIVLHSLEAHGQLRKLV